MGRAIGIDLGTTYSVAAVLREGEATILHNREARPQTRSIVGLKRRRTGDEILVGDVALANWPLAPKDTIISVKRLIGRGMADAEVTRVKHWCLYDIVKPSEGTTDSVRVVMGDRQYSPIEISTLILRKLKEDCEFKLGEPITHAVITVPAYFSESQRDATRRAGLQAGLTVTKILDEPTAAAISFGVDRIDNIPRSILVFDLGGGTFDVSILLWSEKTFLPLMLQGDMWLGGDDFDQVIVGYAIERIRDEYSIDARLNPRFMAELKIAAQKAKEALTSSASADLIVPGLLHGSGGELVDLDIEIDRDQYESMIMPLVGRAIDLTAKALREASYSPDQIDFVLLVGGSSPTPAVQRAVERLFGPGKVIRSIHPKHCVALGAALLASRLGAESVVCGAGSVDLGCGALNSASAAVCVACGASLVPPVPVGDVALAPEIMVSAVAPFNYGVQLAHDEFSVFIAKGEPFPTESSRSMTFYTASPNARMISIPVYGGEALTSASRNEKQGEAFAILPPRLPQGTAIRVRLWLDGDGVFGVAAHLETGADLRPWIVKGERDAKAIEAVQGVERLLATKGDAVSPDELGEMERKREGIFDEMRVGNFAVALQLAAGLADMADKAGSDSLWTRGENLIGVAEYILNRYAWLLDADQRSRIESGVQAVKSARGDTSPVGLRELNDRILALNNIVTGAPELVVMFFAIRNAIHARIHPQEPMLALCLVEDLDEVEEEYKKKDVMAGNARLHSLEQKVVKALQDIESRQTGSLRCSRGHLVPRGSRFCPTCGEDTWLLAREAIALKMRR